MKHYFIQYGSYIFVVVLAAGYLRGLYKVLEKIAV